MAEENETEEPQRKPEETLIEEDVLEFENEGEYEVEEWIGDDWGEEEDDEEEQIPEGPQYVDNGNDTISDSRRHLMWAKKTLNTLLATASTGTKPTTILKN